MNTNLAIFKSLRVYRHLSLLGLLNQIVCNRVTKSKTLVAAAPALYKAALKVPGKWVTHAMVGVTFNKVFTGGNSLQEVQQASAHLRAQQIPIIIDFCAEGILDSPDAETFLDNNSKEFALSAVEAAKTAHHMISIKITGLCSMSLLLRYNHSVLLRDKIWREYSEGGSISAAKLLEGFQSIYAGTTEEDILAYAQSIHNFTGSSLEQFSLSEIDFKINHHPYYLYETAKNDLTLVKLLFPLDSQQKDQIQALRRRLDEILDPSFDNSNNFRVLVDAEQSYVQRAIQSINQQIQAKYNQNKVYIIPTLQNYLKIAQERAVYELEIARRKNLFFSLKLVRGAYLVEETRIAKQGGYQSPIVDCFDKTTENYVQNFIRIVKANPQGQIFAAGHNESTIKTLIALKKAYNPSIKINFAQLLGLGDHLTQLLKSQRETVYKLLPWASTEVMVPYMIRRAEQLSQMRYPLDTQYSLLKHEFLYRFFPA